MPRSRGGAGPSRSAPSRPSAPAPAPRSVAPQQQQRPMSTTAAAPAQQAHPPAQTSQGPGLFGQMASTAAGVAVGSSIGHAIGGFFGGGSSSAPVEQQQQLPTDAYSQTGNAMDNRLYSQSSSTDAAGPCATDIKSFTDCMNQNQGNMTICGWYLEQLKACQQAARQY
ncbi:hypothetical protein LTR99_003618 [Exophiala xenobiotica]|uniref:CHCH domain-containing protein n=1 Tax=Vermiconidia calcicola TaxID=1690605 RepID=A0AAV9Q0Q0_9PEZI|nr:hypothetical protein LTR92_008728 [Exophiala xenobiotica]KAK5531313.1 hypothetical protein LTR25_008420 [Vermiconidia calcicola]KAK5540623.1 hypothetical protein LTR23_006084 [Chaetothyriales sp. CCFEE 6169]KAK5228875.1 hypothetical protein LTR47_008290 [Exophiala xenobiotica]KAK5253352.1 hypothetical protein LTS06_002316 [Exophiala xenobiotica]